MRIALSWLVFLASIFGNADCDAGLRDKPLGARQIVYLDGDDWRADAIILPEPKCSFTAGVDYTGGQNLPFRSAQTSKDCCRACASDPSCAFAVWNGEVYKTCYLKSSDATKIASTTTNVACVPSNSSLVSTDGGNEATAATAVEEQSISIAATVPGDLISDLQRAGIVGDPLYELNFLNSSIWGDQVWNYSKLFDTPASPPAATGGGNRNGDGWAEVVLVLEGVKMGATVRLNGHELGVVSDQFLRYEFAIGALLGGVGEQNKLELSFDPDIQCGGRFMACTGGWDWAFYTNTFQGKQPTFTRGIWKSVYLAPVAAGDALIRHVKPLVYYQGSHPTHPLQDKPLSKSSSGGGDDKASDDGGFRVDVTTYLANYGEASGGLVSVEGAWAQGKVLASKRVSLGARAPDGGVDDVAVSVSFEVQKEQVDLWWPVGMGKQALYNLTVRFVPDAPHAVASTSRRQAGGRAEGVGIKGVLEPDEPARTGQSEDEGNQGAVGVMAMRTIGFRVFTLTTVNDTDTDVVAEAAGREGSGSHGLMFRINGAAVFARGANMIPMEELEGRMSGRAHNLLVESAAAAGMNTLRVWGGGMYLPDAWYDACDAYGIMVYHDLMYATGGPHTNDDGAVPRFRPTEQAEIVNAVRRLSHHPSVVIWDACNECDGKDMYAAFAMTTVAAEDDSRSVWPASPSMGWMSGVDLLSQRPLAGGRGGALFPIGAEPRLAAGRRLIETHGPYQHGNGFPAVNGQIQGKGLFEFPSLVPLNLTQADTGPEQLSLFTSEFGTSVWSSFESVSSTLDPKHWSLHGGEDPDDCTVSFQATCTGTNPIAQRNYPCDNIIQVYFGEMDLDKVGELPFKAQLYLCMIGQALQEKQQIESMRAGNTFGLLLWQLNEVWPTGGWGSLEYGGPEWGTKGQVVGGRWKPLHHLLASSTFRDVFVTCGGDGTCIVKNDGISALPDATVTVQGAVLDGVEEEGVSMRTLVDKRPVPLAAGAGRSAWFNAGNVSGYAWLVASVESGGGSIVAENLMLMKTPKDLPDLPAANVTVRVVAGHNSSSVGGEDDEDIGEGGRRIKVSVSTDAVALFVTLTTAASGRFSDNCFVMAQGEERSVDFIATDSADAQHQSLEATLRVDHLSQALKIAAL